MKPWRITVHCSDTPDGKEYDIEKIRAYHTAKPPQGRGYKDVAYHVVIQPSGVVQYGRSLTEVGAHVADENEGNIGICLIGSSKFTLSQFTSLKNQIRSLIQIYDIKDFDLNCHYQFKSAQAQGKTCPGISINRLLCWYHLENWEAIKPNLIDPNA